MQSRTIDGSLANAVTGDILYTWILTYPRMILAEFKTHRTFSRNTSSSRAIPSRKQPERVMGDPFVPVYIGANQRGMQVGEGLAGWRREAAVGICKVARLPQVLAAFALERFGVHDRKPPGRTVDVDTTDCLCHGR